MHMLCVNKALVSVYSNLKDIRWHVLGLFSLSLESCCQLESIGNEIRQ